MASYNLNVLNGAIGDGLVTKTLEKVKEGGNSFEGYMDVMLYKKSLKIIDKLDNIKNFDNVAAIQAYMTQVAEEVSTLTMERFNISQGEEATHETQEECIKGFARYYGILP